MQALDCVDLQDNDFLILLYIVCRRGLGIFPGYSQRLRLNLICSLVAESINSAFFMLFLGDKQNGCSAGINN